MDLLLLTDREDESSSDKIPARFQKTIHALGEGGINVIHCFVGSANETKRTIAEVQPQIIFSTPYYTLEDAFGRKNIHGLLDSLSIPYIGSDEKSLELVISKQALKRCWNSKGVRTPSSTVLHLNKDIYFGDLQKLNHLTRFPYILKPNREGNSRGIESYCVVRDRNTLRSTAKRLFEEYDEVIVERYLGDFADIREFTVAMIGGNNHALIMPVEIILKTKMFPRLITTKDKDEHRTKAIPIQNQNEKSRISLFAHKALLASGVQDYSRCDILFADNTLFAIEINGKPMVPDLWFQECAADAGMNETQYINAIVLAGIIRNTQEGHLNLQIPSKMSDVIPDEIFSNLIGNRTTR